MTKHLTILVAFLMTVSTQANTQEMTYSDLKNLKVNVLLADSAKGACWTNLTESREYAEEKLRSAGATVVLPPSVPDYLLRLKVMSRRNKALPLCYGSIRVELLTPTMVNRRDHVAYAMEYDAIFMGRQNVNTDVVESIQTFFDYVKNK
ncbi:hypothetical protein N9X94_04755 [Planktomarina temperata]|nr:hypothetical protein [Planktomarina temperata]